jgi:hypothetical protein
MSSSVPNVTVCLASRAGEVLPSSCNASAGFDQCAAPSVAKVLPTDECLTGVLTLPNLGARYASFVFYNRNCTDAADPSVEALLPNSTTLFVAAFSTPDCRVCDTARNHKCRATEIACFPFSSCAAHQCCSLPAAGMALNGTTASTVIVAPLLAAPPLDSLSSDSMLPYIVMGSAVGCCCLLGVVVTVYAWFVKRRQQARRKPMARSMRVRVVDTDAASAETDSLIKGHKTSPNF